MPDSWVLFLDRPGHKVPRTAVGAFRHAIDYTLVETGKDQKLFRDAVGKEYVQDSAGQYVPRFNTRNISAKDAANLRRKRDISATGSGKDATIPEHVGGKKPSPFMSTTKKERGDITNPQGEDLGGEHGRVRIDLFQISSKNIFDLTTKTGQDRWQLSDPNTPKMRQALEDVIRTQEVLIRGTVPRKAIAVL